MPGQSTLKLGVDTENTRRILEIAREVGALLHGDFTLVSGKKSDYYFEGKRLTLTPEGSYLIGKAIFDELADAGMAAVGGVATGGYPIATAVALVSHLEGKPITSFIVKEETKGHGTQRKVEGYLPEGARVAIVDDVITTGGSVLRAIEAVEAAGGKVARVILLVDRHQGGSDTLKQKGYDFTTFIDLWPPKE